MICSYLGPKALSRLLRANKQLYYLLTPVLREQAIRNQDGVTALHWACRRGRASLVKLLLDLGHTCSYKAMHSAVSHRRTEIVTLLLDAGTDIEIADLDGNTTLHIAVGHPVMMRLLLSRGAHHSPRNRQGITPLQIAACELYNGSIAELARVGADLGSEDGEGEIQHYI